MAPTETPTSDQVTQVGTTAEVVKQVAEAYFANLMDQTNNNFNLLTQSISINGEVIRGLVGELVDLRMKLNEVESALKDSGGKRFSDEEVWVRAVTASLSDKSTTQSAAVKAADLVLETFRDRFRRQ